MPNIYKIGAIRIFDDGDGIFKKGKDLVQIKSEEGWEHAAFDSDQVNSALKDIGIESLVGIKLGALKGYEKALEKFRLSPSIASVLKKADAMDVISERTNELEKAAVKAGVDVSDDSAFNAMVEGEIAAIVSANKFVGEKEKEQDNDIDHSGAIFISPSCFSLSF